MVSGSASKNKYLSQICLKILDDGPSPSNFLFVACFGLDHHLIRRVNFWFTDLQILDERAGFTAQLFKSRYLWNQLVLLRLKSADLSMV